MLDKNWFGSNPKREEKIAIKIMSAASDSLHGRTSGYFKPGSPEYYAYKTEFLIRMSGYGARVPKTLRTKVFNVLENENYHTPLAMLQECPPAILAKNPKLCPIR